jgi:hypothetical protein
MSFRMLFDATWGVTEVRSGGAGGSSATGSAGGCCCTGGNGGKYGYAMPVGLVAEA